MKTTKLSVIFKYIYVFAFLIILLATSIISLYIEDNNVSYSENRSLTLYASPTLETLKNGEWFANLESYFKDQIVCRETIISSYYKMLDGFGVKERNNFVCGLDSFILPVNNYVSSQTLDSCNNYGQKQVETMLDINQTVEENGGTMFYVNIPDKAELYAEKYPLYYYSAEEINTLRRNSIIQKANDADITTIETYDLLASHKDDYIYYATDHHFTIKGAYYVYLSILDNINQHNANLNIAFPSWEELDVTTNENRMAGSYLRSFGDSNSISVDYMEYAIPKNMPSFTRYDNGQESNRPLFMKKSTAYTSFMCGDIGNTVIDTNRDELPSILYIGFSFTNALETLSVYNFNRVESIDPRHWDGNICEYIKTTKPDYVVIIRDDIYANNSQFKCTVR